MSDLVENLEDRFSSEAAHTFNSFSTRLLITLANSFDPDQARRIVGPDQGLNYLT